MKRKHKILIYLASLFYLLIVPLLLIYKGSPIDWTYYTTSTDQTYLYFITLCVGLYLLIIVFILNKYYKKMVVLFLIVGSVFMIFLPLHLLKWWKNDFQENLNSQLLKPIEAMISESFLESKSFATEYKSLGNPPKAIIFDVDNGRIDFERSDYSFGQTIKYPHNIDELDYVIFTKKQPPKLLDEVTTQITIAEAVNIDTRKTYKFFTVDEVVGVLNWKNKRLIAKQLFPGDPPNSMRASQIKDDQYFEPSGYKIDKWIYEQLLVKKEKVSLKTKKENTFIILILFYAIPIVLCAMLSELIGGLISGLKGEKITKSEEG